MMNFDAAGRETCVVRETRTNTPLQALNLMNDVTYVEAARMLAERMLTEGGATPEERIAYAFRLAAGRRPHSAETQVLLDGLHYYRDNYQSDPAAALKLVSAGEHARNQKLDTRELAAYAAVASTILNLDAVVTKE
jgi:predicted ATP-grasp superfamily ATP-dependent carboligase